jgi:hypothetical protein
MSFKTFALAAALAAGLTASAHADVLSNAGFETGDLGGWSFSNGFVQVVTSADDVSQNPIFGEHYLPTGGSFFAQLTAGVDVGVYSLLSQDFTLGSASTVSGDAAFLAFDSAPFNDDGYVRILNADTGALVQVLFASDVNTVGDFGHTDWTSFTSNVLGAGNYRLEAGVRNNPEDSDNAFSSELIVDSFAVSAAAVPEPAAWALMLTGFAGLGAALRRRRRALPRWPEPGSRM